MGRAPASYSWFPFLPPAHPLSSAYHQLLRMLALFIIIHLAHCESPALTQNLVEFHAAQMWAVARRAADSPRPARAQPCLCPGHAFPGEPTVA